VLATLEPVLPTAVEIGVELGGHVLPIAVRLKQVLRQVCLAKERFIAIGARLGFGFRYENRFHNAKLANNH
jgi:hypothetical protein